MKPTLFTANSTILVAPLQKFVCDKSHIHGHPTSKSLEKLKVYTWKLCGAIVDGIQALKGKHMRSHIRGSGKRERTHAYPTTGTTTEHPPPAVPYGGLGCNACRLGVRADSPNHTRLADSCRWPHTTPKHWECQACMQDRQRSDVGHIPYKHDASLCRFGGTKDEAVPARKGAHPREPRPTATAHPSADASAVDIEADEPISADNPDQHPQARSSKSASSADDAETAGSGNAPASGSGPGDAAQRARAVRGPDTVERVR